VGSSRNDGNEVEARETKEEKTIKIGCMQWSFRQPILQGEMGSYEFVENLSEMGFEGAELLESYVEGRDAFFITRLGLLGKSRQVNLIGIAVENNFCFAEKEKRRAQIRRVENWIRIASLADVPFVRVATSDVEPGIPYRQQVQCVLDSLRECAEYAEGRNVTLAVENHNGVCAVADELGELIEKVSSRRVGVALDPYNFTWAYRKETSTTPYKFDFREFDESMYAETERLAPLMVLAHGKFDEFDENGDIAVMDYRRILGIYKSVGFDGYISLEYYGNQEPREPLQRAKLYLDDVIRGL
jgi:sugar phosphate isomerase/epimerase